MLPVQWLANARTTLATIIEYIAERNDIAALELLEDIERWLTAAAPSLPVPPWPYCRHARNRCASKLPGCVSRPADHD